MKLVYLADVEAVRMTGHTLSGCGYVRHQKGPYCRDVRDAIDDMEGHELCVSIAPRVGSFDKHEHRLGDSPRFAPELSPTARAIVDSLLAKVHDLTVIQLEDLAYATEPMRHIQEAERNLPDGRKLIGEPLDMCLVPIDEGMAAWRSKRDEYVCSPDPARREAVERERREFDELLAAL